MRIATLTALLAASALCAPAQAQTAPAAAPTAGDVAALKAQLQALQAQVDALERQLAASSTAEAPSQAAPAAPAAAKTAEAPPAPSWKGAPQFEDKEKGFSFKPKGFVQIDTGHVGNPEGAIATSNLGYRTRARRIVFGAEGSLPAGFGYKAEFNFAGGSVDYEDVVLTWQPDATPVLLTIGYAYPLAGLDTMTSSRLGSFLERSQANDAFNFGRRLGASLALSDPKDRFTLTAGLYQAAINSDFSEDRWQASIRGTWSPTIGADGRLHLGLNYQYRRNSQGSFLARYRGRPFSQLTDFRFVDTGGINATGDHVAGAELGAILGPVHFAGEAHKLWVDGYRPGTAQDSAGLVLDNAPDFFAGYLEAGVFLTGDTRGYKGGKWDRVKVRDPIGKGGIGAIQLNARIERLDLSDVFTARQVDDPIAINGGRQTGYLLGVIWNPIDYVRFMLQYARIEVEGGPNAAIVRPDSTRPASERRYGADSVALRAQVEF